MRALAVVLLALLGCHHHFVLAATPSDAFIPFSANRSAGSNARSIETVTSSSRSDRAIAPLTGDATAALQDAVTDAAFAVAGAFSHLASIALPLGEDDNRLDQLLQRHQPIVPRRRRSSRRVSRRSQRRQGGPVFGGVFTNGILSGMRDSSPPPAPMPAAPPSAAYQGHCTQHASALLIGMAAGLRRSLVFAVQEGKLDFGLVGDSANETDACGPAGCAFSNPSSPYGLTILPLAPEEDLDNKLRADSTPSYIVHNLEGNAYGGKGLSPVWQLRQDEVVLVAGCTPIQEASRYFGATPYIYSAYNATRGSWVSLFASMGDSASIVRGPQSTSTSTASSIYSSTASSTTSSTTTAGCAGSSNAAQEQPPSSSVAHVPINRLNATQLPEYTTSSPSVSLFALSSFMAALSGRSPPAAPAAAGVTTNANMSLPPVTAHSGPTQQPEQQQTQATDSKPQAQQLGLEAQQQPALGELEPPASTSQQPVSQQAQCTGSSSAGAFDAFSVFIMGANPAAVTLAAEAAKDGAQRAAALLGLSAAAPFINILPIPGPAFGEAVGLQPTDSYYMLMLRNIVPYGALDEFKSYAAAGPLRAWRATPLIRLPSDTGNAGSSGSGSGSGSSSGSSSSSSSGSSNGGAPGSGGGISSVDAADGSSDGAGSAATAPSAAPGLLSQLVGAAGLSVGQQQYSFPAASVIPRRSGVNVLASGNVSNVGNADPQAGVQAEAAATEAAAAEAAAAVAAGQAVGRAFTAALQAGANRIEPAVHAAAGAAEPVAGFRSLQGDLHLQPALDFLIGRLTRAFAGNFTIAHSIGSSSALGVLGVDWGLDCLQRGVDFCNGDNRDTNYITSYPLVTLDRPGQLLLLVGVNHVASGMATYLNVALADPVSRLGVSAFEDTELEGSAQQWLAGTPFQWAASQLYAVAYSRSCTGVFMPCKEVPTKGPRSVPLPRPMLVISRPYVNPHTGVGPADTDLTMMRTMLLTPASLATRASARPRYDEAIFAGGYGCVQSLAGHTQCVPGGSPDVCCGAVRLWNEDACWCSQAGEVLLSTMPALLTPPLLRELARRCDVGVNDTCSAR